MTDVILEEYRSRNIDQALAHLIEECGEVLAAAGKSIRFGLYSVNPELEPEMQETNEQWLLREISDLEQAISELRRLKENSKIINPH